MMKVKAGNKLETTKKMVKQTRFSEKQIIS